MSRLFEELREGETYINMSFRERTGFEIKKMLDEEEYYIHYIKTKNESYKEDSILQELYREKKRVNKQIAEREQYLNYGNDD